MKQAFTMVELIFVIVIIGILAAVATQKLAATRDDARNAADCQNVVICLTDVAATYTASGNADSDTAACSAASSYISIGTTTVQYDDSIPNCNAESDPILFASASISI